MDRLLTAEEIAQCLGVKTQWVWAQARAGRIRHVRLGRYRRFRESAVEAWVCQLEDVDRPPTHARRSERAAGDAGGRPPEESRMTTPDDDPLAATLERARGRRARFSAWLGHLRASDPEFAEASTLYPDDMSEWQAAVYLLTGCEEVWRQLARAVMGDRSIGPVVHELERPRRPWSGSETAVLRWAAHFWDVDRHPAEFPYVFEEFYFRRWISACHLRQNIPPALLVSGRA